MKYRLTIKADVNDADYISESHDFTETQWKKVEPLITRVAKALKEVNGSWDCERNNEPKDVELSDKDRDQFSGYMPYMDNEDVHTIESIELIEIGDIKQLF